MSLADTLNKLCKWRTVLAGWHYGTSALQDSGGYPTPGLPAMRDLMDKWLIMRAENSAILALLVEKKLVTADEFSRHLEIEARHLDKDMEKQFPGFRTSQFGVVIYDPKKAEETTLTLGFPP